MKHEYLIRFAEKFRLPATSSKVEQSKFFGSWCFFVYFIFFKFYQATLCLDEVREDSLSETVHVAISSEGASYDFLN